MNKKIQELEPINLTPPRGQTEPSEPEWEELIPLEEPPYDPSKTGPKPENKKKLVALEVKGYQVGRGVNRRIVSPEDVYKLAALGCSDREIAIWFDIKEDTLRYNFADIMAKGRQEMKTQLRNAMFKNALGGNAALQIFLAKNMLGMSDNPQNSEEHKPLPWADD